MKTASVTTGSGLAFSFLCIYLMVFSMIPPRMEGNHGEAAGISGDSVLNRRLEFVDAVNVRIKGGPSGKDAPIGCTKLPASCHPAWCASDEDVLFRRRLSVSP